MENQRSVDDYLYDDNDVQLYLNSTPNELMMISFVFRYVWLMADGQ